MLQACNFYIGDTENLVTFGDLAQGGMVYNVKAWTCMYVNIHTYFDLKIFNYKCYICLTIIILLLVEV